jgi:putrescine transport system permease protein
MKRTTHSRFPLIKLLMLSGFAFLYAPIAILIIYSFNKSRLVTVWAGFSTEWYGTLLQDSALMNAVATSLKVASSSATLAVLLGTLAGVALSKLGLFRGRTIFTGMLSAPFIMPEVITGFSLLLLFVTLEQMIGWPEGRGVLTIMLAHTTLGMAYVAVLVQARLTSFDKSLEEAAADLGAKPFKVFMVITLPLILPALIAGWLLSFTLSLDDLVIASFTSGPGATTLPMLIYSKVRLGVTPEVNALATLIVLLVGFFATLVYWLVLRGKKI